MNFKEYLQKAKLSGRTIKEHLSNIEKYTDWCSSIGIPPENTTYNHLLKYIETHRETGKSKATINIYLNSLTWFNNWLITTKKRTDNPAMYLRIKKESPKLNENILKPEQLEELYKDYSNKPVWEFTKPVSELVHKRNVVVLGLMIFQGMHRGDIMKSEPGHINLKDCKIYVPGTRRSNSRVLQLHAGQVLPLQEYLQDVRSRLTREHHKDKQKLFPANGHSFMHCFISDLKENYSQVKSPVQVRTSVIMHWLKQYNIRQVQYMCGHRHISSTERYKQQDISDLQKQLNLFHPMSDRTDGPNKEKHT